ncbi:hypothetical protein GGS20DRAFT_565606 [Poronia punctata]|nr:hypothetical protein GGS20DRAFT_565606 [Poronia punctata]
MLGKGTWIITLLSCFLIERSGFGLSCWVEMVELMRGDSCMPNNRLPYICTCTFALVMMHIVPLHSIGSSGQLPQIYPMRTIIVCRVSEIDIRGTRGERD